MVSIHFVVFLFVELALLYCFISKTRSIKRNVWSGFVLLIYIVLYCIPMLIVFLIYGGIYWW